MQEGVVGLLRALERYDASLGTPFWAYAGWWVRQAMQQLVSELMRPVVSPTGRCGSWSGQRSRARLAQANGREPRSPSFRRRPS